MTSLRCSTPRGWIGAPKRISIGWRCGSGFPGLRLHPVAADRHDLVGARHVDRHRAAGRAAAARTAAPERRRPTLPSRERVPSANITRLQPSRISGRGARWSRVEAAAVARHRDGAEEQRDGIGEPALGVEVVRRGGDDGAPPPGVRQRAQDRGRVHVAGVVGDEDDRRRRAVEVLAARPPCGACRSPSPARAAPSARIRAAPARAQSAPTRRPALRGCAHPCREILPAGAAVTRSSPD